MTKARNCNDNMISTQLDQRAKDILVFILSATAV